MNFEIYECKKSIKELDVDINILQNKLNDLMHQWQSLHDEVESIK
mgnify:CR=1 FL=1